MSDLVVRDNPAELRYELIDGDTVIGEIRYRSTEDAVALVHTDIEPGRERQGLGGLLVERALDDLRRRGLKVVPVCPFVRAWMRRHPEHGAGVVPDTAVPD